MTVFLKEIRGLVSCV